MPLILQKRNGELKTLGKLDLGSDDYTSTLELILNFPDKDIDTTKKEFKSYCKKNDILFKLKLNEIIPKKLFKYKLDSAEAALCKGNGSFLVLSTEMKHCEKEDLALDKLRFSYEILKGFLYNMLGKDSQIVYDFLTELKMIDIAKQNIEASKGFMNYIKKKHEVITLMNSLEPSKHDYYEGINLLVKVEENIKTIDPSYSLVLTKNAGHFFMKHLCNELDSLDEYEKDINKNKNTQSIETKIEYLEQIEGFEELSNFIISYSADKKHAEFAGKLSEEFKKKKQELNREINEYEIRKESVDMMSEKDICKSIDKINRRLNWSLANQHKFSAEFSNNALITSFLNMKAAEDSIKVYLDFLKIFKELYKEKTGDEYSMFKKGFEE